MKSIFLSFPFLIYLLKFGKITVPIAIPAMAFFIPLITATGGNVGIQSSALIVQGIANQSLSGSILSKLFKEFGEIMAYKLKDLKPDNCGESRFLMFLTEERDFLHLFWYLQIPVFS